MIMLPRADLSRLRGLFGAAQLGFVVDSMAAGQAEFEAWTDDLDCCGTGSTPSP
ncbi:hypothetical protein [Microlunatus parietis]|uniref:Uncharacterized protein n=1 Tax=Microlunatus parietis TaxID=682979 RepID=A0A7Y9IEU8_9ACTN|nr:hypothetical protein [Microlunatus parietis]NYE75534.1 hypothetical protein [Microlunatus parietis]